MSNRLMSAQSTVPRILMTGPGSKNMSAVVDKLCLSLAKVVVIVTHIQYICHLELDNDLEAKTVRAGRDFGEQLD